MLSSSSYGVLSKAALVVALAIAAASSAAADPVALTLTFLDTTDSVTAVIGSITGCGGSEACTAQLLVRNAQPVLPAPPNFNIYEDAGLTVLSDTLAMSKDDTTAGQLDVTFTSDTDGGPALTALTNATNLQETGLVQNVANINFDDVNGNVLATLAVNFQSDAETPEPSSVALLATVLGAAGILLRRRFRHA